jgi:outer membrane protein assembly factor BamD (BamD/ComL family)
LSQELKALGEVESLLKAGQARGALSALDHYRRTFPRQQLGLEAEVLTIQALAGSGATAAAQERAAHFLERHPNSPLSARVRRYAE